MGAGKRGSRLARIGATAIAAATVAAACTAAAASSASAATSGSARATAVAANTVSGRSATPAAMSRRAALWREGGPGPPSRRCSSDSRRSSTIRADRQSVRRRHPGGSLGVPGGQRPFGGRGDRPGHEEGPRAPQDVQGERPPTGRDQDRSQPGDGRAGPLQEPPDLADQPCIDRRRLLVHMRRRRLPGDTPNGNYTAPTSPAGIKDRSGRCITRCSSTTTDTRSMAKPTPRSVPVSHGCVRIPFDIADLFYKDLKISETPGKAEVWIYKPVVVLARLDWTLHRRPGDSGSCAARRSRQLPGVTLVGGSYAAGLRVRASRRRRGRPVLP